MFILFSKFILTFKPFSFDLLFFVPIIFIFKSYYSFQQFILYENYNYCVREIVNRLQFTSHQLIIDNKKFSSNDEPIHVWQTEINIF